MTVTPSVCAVSELVSVCDQKNAMKIWRRRCDKQTLGSGRCARRFRGPTR